MIMGNSFTTETRRISFENKSESSFTLIEKEYFKERKMLRAAAMKKQAEGGCELKNDVGTELPETEISIEAPCNERLDCLNNDKEEIPPQSPDENENDNEIEDKISETNSMKHEEYFDLQSKMLECYEVNQQHPLRCSGIVEAFNKCVLSYRMEKE